MNLSNLHSAGLKGLKKKQRALRWKIILFFRNSAIQRFEFTVEILWKTVKTFLKEIEGIECRSPKSCIRGFFSVGYLSEDEVLLLLRMIDDRNLTSHAYIEEVAEEIFRRIVEYEPLIEKIINILEERVYNENLP
ncbi:nucleotidyltransferase substrate binding protein, HI0074 family [Desulfurobacterium pacificum]|uniref:Nucleotidyltransferase substrate binding protein, HI0074 family n=1 Tax=Desulfurobacterium pacificum TaxID=240166 RepID=A0ABY1NNW1_9BACT|nr:HI0074 family nucleotidyltransferase substrate-binding subunit [Desulfurobacterium pacificum]SMP13958.1 nucleotidyltransferase substrate binding protein, HI0074 family [Desulfurobacterium pacificum]